MLPRSFLVKRDDAGRSRYELSAFISSYFPYCLMTFALGFLALLDKGRCFAGGEAVLLTLVEVGIVQSESLPLRCVSRV